MRRLIILLLVGLLMLPINGFTRDLDIGVSISDGKIRSFYFALGDYFRVPEERIIIIKKRYPVILEEELPVVMIISREANVDPDIIIELRKRGYSWYDIMIRFRVYPEVVFKRYIIYGPPYGKAWGYHKHKKKKVIFLDDDIIALANIKFISEYYREDPEIIIKYKEKYPRFLDVHYEIYEHKKGLKKEKEWKERDSFREENRSWKEEKELRKEDKRFWKEEVNEEKRQGKGKDHKKKDFID